MADIFGQRGILKQILGAKTKSPYAVAPHKWQISTMFGDSLGEGGPRYNCYTPNQGLGRLVDARPELSAFLPTARRKIAYTQTS